jgi:hypothetical protein
VAAVPVPVRLRAAAEPLLPQAQVVVAHRVVARRPVVAVEAVGLEDSAAAVLPVPRSPSFLFAMARNMKSRATRVLCVPVPRFGWLQKDLKSLSV